MATATWVRDELDSHGIAYEELHHPDAYTAQQVAQQEHVKGGHVAKVVCVLADGVPTEVILPASRRIDLDRLQQRLGCGTIRLATEKEMEAYFSGCEVGAIPALRHWPGVDIIMDGSLRTSGDILIQGGTHRDALRMKFDDWFGLVQPRVENFSEPLQTAPSGREKRWYWPW